MGKRKHNVSKLLIMTVTVLILGAGCKNQQPDETMIIDEVKEPKIYNGMTSLSYDFGSYNEGYYEFQLYYENSIPFIQAKGSNGVQLSYKHEIEKEKIIALEEALNQENVAAMDGFHKRDKNILDGYSFSLDIQYSGDELSSSGYMRYPKNYAKIDKVISDFFFDNIEANTTFDRNNPYADSTAYDEYAFLGVPSTNSKIKYFSYSYEIVGEELVRFEYDSQAEAMFDVSYSYEALNELNDYEWKDTILDSSIRLEDLTKLEELIKSYNLFSYSGYFNGKPDESDTESASWTEIRVVYEDGTDIDFCYTNTMNERFSGWEEEFRKEIENLFGISISDLKHELD